MLITFIMCFLTTPRQISFKAINAVSLVLGYAPTAINTQTEAEEMDRFNVQQRWVQVMAGSALLLGGLLASQSAVADCAGVAYTANKTVSIKTPLGKTVQAEKVTCPANGKSAQAQIEAQILESLKQIRDGKFSDWRKSHCFPARCDTDVAWEQIKNFNLATSKKSVAYCLQSEDEIWVTTRKGNPDVDKQVKVWIFCGESRMPVPSTHEKLNGKWYVQTFSW
jgi:hypothetical protein